MARLLVLSAAAVVLCAALVAGVADNNGCKDVITGYSGTFGKRASGQLERFNNQTAQWRGKGAITKVNVYYSFGQKCIQGIKVTYGYNSQDAKLLGQEQNLSTRDLTLEEGEHFNKAQIKAGACVEYLRLATSKGHVLEIGNKESATQLITSYPNKPTGFLAAIRGYEAYAKTAEGSTSRGSLQTLQFVWANCNPLAGSVPVPVPTPAAKPAPPPAEEPAAPAAVETPLEGAPEALTPVSGLASCPAVTDMCSQDATSSSTAYCPALAPYKKATCLGGCCASSGKCTSSSCAISGIGKEVSNTICYGLNPAIAIGASPNCRGLACKLSIPGCTSDLLGGSCLGTVVDLSGVAASFNPAGSALVGYPCLDVTPSDKTLTADGKLTLSGGYVAKLWSICDCQAPATIGNTNIPVPRLGKLNLTDIKSLVDVLKPGLDASHPLQSIVDAVKSKIPPLIVPDGASPVNLTNALGFLGSLVNKGAAVLESGAVGPDGAAADPSNPVSAIANLLKGASAVAAASNSSNPLGALLGALAPSGPNGEKNPLAGLGSLVSALAGHGADTTEKADVLNAVLGGLSGSTAAAPGADLLGTVSKLLSGAGTGTPSADVAGLLSKIQSSGPEILKTVLSAVEQGKQAIGDGKIDLQGLLSKAQQFVGHDGATDTDGNPTVSAILNGIQALSSPHGTDGPDGAAANPLGFLSGLKNSTGGLSLQSLVDAASKAGPLLQSLSGADGAGGNPLAGVLKAFAGGEGGQGLDLSSILNLAGKVGPLLQALGGGAGGAPGGDPLASVLNAVGLGEGGASGSGLNLQSVKGLLEAASKAGPVLQSLAKAAGADGNSPLAGLQAFLDKLPHMGGGAAPSAAPASS